MCISGGCPKKSSEVSHAPRRRNLKKSLGGRNMFGQKTQALQERAYKVLPLGVNSNFRYWGEGITPYVQRAKGAHLWDVDGKEYIDYRMAFGPIILGHAFEDVDRKVIEEIQKGVLP
ncbi:MAG: aminotransferase class III-fold pyridoxal phosphate-dependent enzyme, partial [Chloroflexi bacterium]|nr:aminotransferase class III-fold pyridoxal phosphate-dependent enzyme [Chloroflexota bacterium]